MDTTRVLSVFNEKGGCGKTTTVVQLAYNLAQNHKVLLLDIDQHSGSTIHLTDRADHKFGSYDLFKSEGVIPVKKVALRTDSRWGNLLLVPADRRLSNLEHELAGTIDRDRILKRVIEQTDNYFDFIVIDTPPVLGIETRNALIASTHYLIVTDLSKYSEIGVQSARLFAERVRERANKKLTEIGVVLIGCEKTNAKVVKEALDTMKQDDFFLKEWIIPRSVKVIEAQRQNRALGEVFPSSSVAKIYKRFADHIMETLR